MVGREHPRVVLVEIYPRFRQRLGQVVPQPKSALLTCWLSPRILCVLSYVFAAWVQPVNRDNVYPRLRSSRSKESESRLYSDGYIAFFMKRE